MAKSSPFTLIEVVVVLAIVALIAGLVLPLVGRLPEGLRIDKCISGIEAAFQDAALRSRATGATVKVVVDVAKKQLQLEELPALPLPPVAASPAAAVPAGAAPDAAREDGRYSGGKTYALPNGIQWRLEERDSGQDGAPAYFFYPNGEAAGPRLEFATGDRRFNLDMDRLTGRPAIAEVEK